MKYATMNQTEHDNIAAQLSAAPDSFLHTEADPKFAGTFYVNSGDPKLPGLTYRIAFQDTGSAAIATCTCKDFIFRPAHACKHIRAAYAHLLTAALAAAAQPKAA